jgi:hypothetical protein
MLSNSKMAETIETTPETMENIPATNESIPATTESTPATKESIPETHADPEPKKRGRPKGAPDKAPRKKKIVIVEEALQPEEPEPAPMTTAKASSSTEPPPSPGMHLPEPEPPSPRTTLREASRHILQLQTLRDVARKSHLSSLYTKGLHSLI